jgi:hypothetical protein
VAQLPKPKKAPKKRSVEQQLDDMARELCRLRGRCEAAGWRGTKCGGPLQWAHILDRANRRNGLRWRSDNCFLLCRDHHFRWTKKNLAEWTLFIFEKRGVEWYVKANNEALYGEKIDRKKMRDDLECQLSGCERAHAE